MAKKKRDASNSKKRREKERQHLLLSMNETELVNEADRLFDDGEIRDSIKIYQMALKQIKVSESKDPIKAKLFTAYAARAKELRDKNMVSEAESVEKQALASLPDPFCMNSADIAFLLKLKLCSPEQAFESYNTFYSKNGASSYLERILAEMLVKRDCWQSVLTLNDEVALKKDTPLVKPAVLLMDQGEWDAALEQMQSLQRSSPFAHIKLFCKAMSAFYKDNESEMLKAISMIPDDSTLVSVTDALQYIARQNRSTDSAHTKFKGSDNKDLHDERDKASEEKSLSLLNKNRAVIQCLWSGPFEIHEKLDTIITLVKKENYNDYLSKNILEFARLLMPKQIESVVQFILETIWSINQRPDSSKERQLFRMAEQLIKKKAQILIIKKNTICMDDPLGSALEYFKHLDKEFAAKEEQQMAKAMIIHHIARIIFKSHAHSFFANEKKRTLQLFGITSTESTTALLEMINFALGIDPENRELYDLAMEIPLFGRDAKNIKESILLTKCAVFPDDPEPLLKLASLYHDKNAYRKAENTLQKALELAPHDNRVLDQHVISLLISADRSAAKKKFHLIRQDIEKAKKFDSRHCAILIIEKSIFYKVAETDQADETEIETALNVLPLPDQLKFYAMLMLDLDEKLGYKISSSPKPSRKKAIFAKTGSTKSGVEKINPLQTVQILFKKALSRSEELTSWDLFNLLTPFPEEWKHLFQSNDLILSFAENCKSDLFYPDCSTDIFSILDDKDLLELIQRVDNVKVYPVFLAELEQRLRKLEKELYQKQKRVRLSGKKTAKPEKITAKPEDRPDRPESRADEPGQNSKKENKRDYNILKFYKVTLKNISTSRYSYNEYLDLVKNLDPETEIILKQASKKLSQKAVGNLRDALECFDFQFLLYGNLSTSDFIDDLLDDFGDDDGFDDDFDSNLPFSNPFSKGGFNPFAGGKFPERIDIDSITPAFIKIFSNVLKMMLKTPDGDQLKKELNLRIDRMEDIIDTLALRGKSDQELKKIKKEIINNDQECKITVALINGCYKKEAIARFSREARILFIE